MPKQCAALLLMVAVLLMASAPALTSAQQTLSHDLLVLVVESAYPSDPEANLLERVDGRTLETSLFFEDDTVHLLHPLSWSPDGSLLVILFYQESDYHPAATQLCLVTRGGTFHRCMEDLPPKDPGGAADGLYAVTWSEDSQRIYFMSDVQEEDNYVRRRLIEADVTTGETLRIIFETTFEQGVNVPIFSWTSDLAYILNGLGWSSQLVDLATHEAVEVSAFLSDDVQLIRSGVCPGFSPSDEYIAVRTESVLVVEDFEAPFYQLRLFDKSGRGTVVLDENSGYGPVWWVECPVWQSDETTLFFLATTYDAPLLDIGSPAPRIFKYILATGSLEVYFYDPSLYNIFSLWPLMLSPDGEHIAYHSRYRIQDGLQSEDRWKVVVVYPDGSFIELKDVEKSIQFPIWVPGAANK